MANTVKALQNCSSFPVVQFLLLFLQSLHNEVVKRKWILDSALNLYCGIKPTVSCLHPNIRLRTVTELQISSNSSTLQCLAEIIDQCQEIWIRVEMCFSWEAIYKIQITALQILFSNWGCLQLLKQKCQTVEK